MQGIAIGDWKGLALNRFSAIAIRYSVNESIWVSGKLPTYPSPKVTLILNSHLVQNVDLREG